MASSPSTPPADTRTRVSALREALATRVVVADGAMGTMLQAQNPTLDDFQQLEGCNEVLNLTRPDIVRSVHEEYFAAGVDCVETNTFGANHSALGEYDIPERVHELSEAAPASPARSPTSSRPRRPAALGAGLHGPRHQAPHPRPRPVHRPARRLPAQRRGTGRGRRGRTAGGDHAGPAPDQGLGARARRALDVLGLDLPLIVSVTVETTGTMLLGSEIGAALTALEPLGIDMIGLNCATGPAEMSEHLRYLARHSRIPLTCMPNAGLPVLGKDAPTTR